MMAMRVDRMAMRPRGAPTPSPIFIAVFGEEEEEAGADGVVGAVAFALLILVMEVEVVIGMGTLPEIDAGVDNALGLGMEKLPQFGDALQPVDVVLLPQLHWLPLQ